MAQATIGSLNVVLGMDAGDFTSGAQAAERAIDRLGTRIGAVAGVVQGFVQGIMDSIGGMVAALGAGFKKAIDSADAMDELAQKLGFTVEALSKLQFAAEIAGVPLETFQMGVTKLNVAMGNLAAGETGGAAARAIDALGISAFDSTGKLRSNEAVLIDIAEKFAEFADGASKSALAVALFGESGAKMIPFLNQGRAGIAQLGEEAERLGVALTSKGAAAAGAFNESLDKLWKVVDGGFKKTMDAALPILQTFVDWLLRDDRAAGALSVTLTALAAVLKVLATAFVILHGVVMNSWNAIVGFTQAAQAAMRLDFSGVGKAWTDTTDKIIERSRAGVQAINQMWGAMNRASPAEGAAGASGLQGLDTPAMPQAPAMQGTGEASRQRAEGRRAEAEAQRLHNEELRRYNELLQLQKEIEEDLDPTAARLAEQQDKLNRAFQKGVIDSQQFGIALSKASAVAQSAYASMASSIIGDISKVFENNKALAIAQALINTYQAVTNAWANVPYPLNIAAAAASLAAGLAQVANIRSTTKDGGGAGGGGGASAAPAAPVEQQQQSFFINLQGQSFGREQVRGLIESINDAIGDGAVLRVA